MPDKILVITSCSKKKGSKSDIAKKLYQGQFFKGVLKFTEHRNYDLWILSAKYGLINAEQKIQPYNQKISNIADIERLRKNILEFPKLLEKYDKILLLMGLNYRLVFEKYMDNPKIIYSIDHRGNGGYNQLICELNKRNEVPLDKLYDLDRREISVNTINKIRVII